MSQKIRELIKRKNGTESPRGLWDNVRRKEEQGIAPRKPGSKGAPTDEAIKRSQQ